MKITIGYLYPDVMSTYGDRGNVETVRRRCSWRGIDASVTELRLGDRVPAGLDLLMIGGGGEAQQRLIAADLYFAKAAAIRDTVADGAAALAVGAGYELFGRFCQPEQGAEFPGVDVFDSWTIRRSGLLSEEYGTISAARADRWIGELVVRWNGRLLVGFENHGGGTYLGPAARPLGTVLAGHGNSGDGTEGVVCGGAVGTNLRGPCLPKNPALADFLITAAVGRRYPGADLRPLPDDLELAARDAAVHNAWQAATARRVRLVGGSLRRSAGQQQPGRPRRAASRPARPMDAGTRR